MAKSKGFCLPCEYRATLDIIVDKYENFYLLTYVYLLNCLGGPRH